MSENTDNGVMAHEIVRFIPYLYVFSPSLERVVKIRIATALRANDATEIIEKLGSPMAETAVETLKWLGRERLLEEAQDWRYLSGSEVDRYVAVDRANEDGAAWVGNEVPPDVVSGVGDVGVEEE